MFEDFLRGEWGGEMIEVNSRNQFKNHWELDLQSVERMLSDSGYEFAISCGRST